MLVRYEVHDQVVNVLRCFLDPLFGRGSRIGDHRMIEPQVMASRRRGANWTIRGRFAPVAQALPLTPEIAQQLSASEIFRCGASLIGNPKSSDLQRRALLAMTQWGSASTLEALEVQLALFLAPIEVFFNKSGRQAIDLAMAVLALRPPPTLPGVDVVYELELLYRKRGRILHEGLRNESADAAVTEGDVYIAKRLSNQVIMNVLEFFWEVPGKKELVRQLGA